MGLAANVLLDVESGTEIIFDALEPSVVHTYVNDVVEYSRFEDGVHETIVSAANQRQIDITVRTTNPSNTRRLLDFFRSTGQPLVLLMGFDDFASEVVIKDFEMQRGNETATPISLSLAAYGTEGQMRLASDPRCTQSGATITADANAIGGYASVLDAAGDKVSFSFTSNGAYLPEGQYMILVRAKASAPISNDMILRFYDSDRDDHVILRTVSVDDDGYAYYAAVGTASELNLDHTFQVYPQKLTASVNSISVDVIAYVATSGEIEIPDYTIALSDITDEFALSTEAGPRAVPLTTIAGVPLDASTDAPGFYTYTFTSAGTKTFYYDWAKTRYLRIMSVNVASSVSAAMTVYHCWRVLGKVKYLWAYTMNLTAAQAYEGCNTDYPIVLDVPPGTIGWIEVHATAACTVSVNVMARYDSII